MARDVLLAGSQVDDDGGPRGHALEQLGAAHGLHGRAEIGAGGAVRVGDPVRGDGAERGEECVRIVPGDPVADAVAVPARDHEPCGPQGLQVRRREADGDRRGARQGLDAPLPLGQEVEHLDPVAVRERLADAREDVVELVLGGPRPDARVPRIRRVSL